MSERSDNIASETRTEMADRPPRSRAVHVKNVPEDIWRRARQNALALGMPFKDFVIHLLANSNAGR